MTAAEQKTFITSRAENKQHIYELLRENVEEATGSCISFRGFVWCGVLFFFLIPYWIGLFKIAQWVFNVLN